MSHIFFERLEQRKSTQSFYSWSGLFENITYYGLLSPYPTSDYTNYNYNYNYLNQNSWLTPSYQPSSWLTQDLWSSPDSWLTPSYQPSSWLTQDPWHSPDPWLSPLWPTPSKSKSWTNPLYDFDKIIILSPFPSPNDPGPMCYAMGPPGPFGNSPTSFIDKLSKVEKVRKTLIAFFQKKGTLSENHRQRLLSSPFDKA